MTRIHLAAIILTGILLLIDLAAIGYILIKKMIADAVRRYSKDVAKQLVELFPHLTDDQIKKKYPTRGRRKILLDQYVETRQSLRVTRRDDERIRRLFEEMGLVKRYRRQLNSPIRFRRIEAAVYLGSIGGSCAREALETTFRTEKRLIVKLYISYALSEIGSSTSIMLLAESLIGSPEWYQSKVRLFITDFGFELKKLIPELLARREPEMHYLLTTIATECAGMELVNYLEDALNKSDSRIRQGAAYALTKHYPDSAVSRSLLSDSDTRIREFAVESLGKTLTTENVLHLLAFLDNADFAEQAVRVLSDMCNRSHLLLEFVMHRYNDERYKQVRHRIVEVLANRVEYFIVRLHNVDKEESEKILDAMLENGFVNTIFGYLTRNKNREIENTLLAIIKRKSAEIEHVRTLVRQFLPERMLHKMGMKPYVEGKIAADRRTSAVVRTRLLLQLSALLLFFPLLFILRYWSEIPGRTLGWLGIRYIIDGNYYLIFYSTLISSIYLIVLFFSTIGSIRQFAYSRVKKKTFLFRRNLLPGISVIGPAFNEENTIIESVNSLLNLQYPDHEVIVVNDGSKDHTLNVLIEYFKLEKVDNVIHKDIITRPIRGIYRNRSLPKLTVVDKFNGGKADSLNAGINIARKEYFCGIDADSLLSEDALVKIIGTSLDLDVETIAVGGNIFPVNGCSVNRGVIEKTSTPRNPLANFQFIEYIRAFMAGRIGWAFLDSLLIISGAFGLFKRSRVVECGGYLTKSGKFGLDTVGEDMELVVRLTRHMREKGLQYKIGYSHNANCWTEVPERLNILLRQRERWHRGLIEILSVHGDMLIRPRFGRIGWIALPYFKLFEVLGPWIEMQGYLMVVAAATFGILNSQMALLLFLATVMLGVFISIASIIIAEQEVNYFSMKDVLKLIGYAIIENFGFRQLMSMWRVVGYISVLRGTSGWGEMVRQGFGAKSK